jgi:hypothetical protein
MQLGKGKKKKAAGFPTGFDRRHLFFLNPQKNTLEERKIISRSMSHPPKLRVQMISKLTDYNDTT